MGNYVSYYLSSGNYVSYYVGNYHMSYYLSYGKLCELLHGK